MRFEVELTPDEDGWYVAEVSVLPGCVSQGETREAALSNIRDAIEGWLKVRLMRFEENGEGPGPAQAPGVETVTVEV